MAAEVRLEFNARRLEAADRIAQRIKKRSEDARRNIDQATTSAERAAARLELASARGQAGGAGGPGLAGAAAGAAQAGAAFGAVSAIGNLFRDGFADESLAATLPESLGAAGIVIGAINPVLGQIVSAVAGVMGPVLAKLEERVNKRIDDQVAGLRANLTQIFETEREAAALDPGIAAGRVGRAVDIRLRREAELAGREFSPQADLIELLSR